MERRAPFILRVEWYALTRNKIFSDANNLITCFGVSDPPVILVDMDNTLVNWESQFERLMGKHFPQIPLVPPLERTQFKM